MPLIISLFFKVIKLLTLNEVSGTQLRMPTEHKSHGGLAYGQFSQYK